MTDDNIILVELREILAGIDEAETESDNGWWDTSTGAKFGAKKLAEVEALFLAALKGRGAPPVASRAGTGGELLPCPFCGGAVELMPVRVSGDSEWIRHVPHDGPNECPVEFSAFNIANEGSLTARWNTRAPIALPTTPNEELVERVAKAMFDACMQRRYEGNTVPQWPPSRELAEEWHQHATAALAALRAGTGGER